MVTVNDKIIARFRAGEDELFRDWLNEVDATITYDKRFATGSVATWRQAFDDGNTVRGACKMFGVLPIQLR